MDVYDLANDLVSFEEYMIFKNMHNETHKTFENMTFKIGFMVTLSP